jgi:hypothetical protein
VSVSWLHGCRGAVHITLWDGAGGITAVAKCCVYNCRQGHRKTSKLEACLEQQYCEGRHAYVSHTAMLQVPTKFRQPTP